MKKLGSALKSFFCALGRGLKNFFGDIGSFFAQFVRDIRQGDLWVRLSLLVCGTGYIARRQYIKGILVTLLQAALMVLFPIALWPSLRKVGTLGTEQYASVYNPATMKNEVNDYDHSFKILLFSLIALCVLAVAVILYVRNIRAVRQLQQNAERGKHINSFREDVAEAFNTKFHRTLLALPSMGVVLFTVIPLLVMICIAFTNYDKQHLAPKNLFTWVGFSNFESLINMTSSSTFSYSFGKVLGWTLLWAFVATFTTYMGGVLLAMFINNRKTKVKKFWRTCFVVAIAVPQFVSLLLVRNFFANTGIVNTICSDLGITEWLKSLGLVSQNLNYIPFLTEPGWAKVMIVLINMWVGIPYVMLIATGVLLNIPQDILESARIDGANAWQSFRKITMPYMLFVTGPYLVNSLVGNINNFNIIYLLTQDVYVTKDQLLANSKAKEVDLLVTWLYRLTQEEQNYKMASVLGVLVFVVCAVFTLVAFSTMIRGDKEENFQ